MNVNQIPGPKSFIVMNLIYIPKANVNYKYRTCVPNYLKTWGIV